MSSTIIEIAAPAAGLALLATGFINFPGEGMRGLARAWPSQYPSPFLPLFS
jgi:hypothetical protein